MLRKIDCVMIRVDDPQAAAVNTLAAKGKCAVIQDPFGTVLCILDMTKGPRT